jgi:glycerol-3-phosphate acyltransferase PlsY
MDTPLLLSATFLVSYLVGSIPFAYTIVRLKTGEDVTEHGSGNVGAMNVKRSTGSWTLFALAMVLDMCKGLLPVLATRLVAAEAVEATQPLAMQLSVAGAVFGHNYSLWMALIKRRFGRTGKGLATGAGALIAYDWRYALAVVVVGLTVIAATRYMMAGQVAAALTLPVTAIALRSSDWPFALLMGLVVYLAHHKRFLGLLRGEEPKFYINDRQGPRG